MVLPAYTSLNPADEALIRAALAADDKRSKEMSNNQRAYEGAFPPPLKVIPNQPNDNVTVNIIGPVVDIGTHFLFGQMPGLSVQATGELGKQVKAEKRKRAMAAAQKEKAEASKKVQAAQEAFKANAGNPGNATATGTPESEGAPATAKPPAPASDKAEGDEEPQDSAPEEVEEEELDLGPEFDEEPEPTIEEQAQKWLDDCLDANNFDVLLLDLRTNGGVTGTAYPRLDTTSMLPNPADSERPFPTIQDVDPHAMTIAADMRDVRKVNDYIWQYNAGADPRTGTPRYERQIIKRVSVPSEEEGGQAKEQWVIIDQHSTSADGGWITDGQNDWPYAWPPIMHIKNLPQPNSVYGRSDIRRTMIDANKAINRSLSNSARIERFYGHKRMWVKGLKDQQIKWHDMGTGVIIDIPDPTAEVGELQPSTDGGQAYERRKELYAFILEEAGTPSLVLGRTDGTMGTDPSGVSLQIRLIPLGAKIESYRKCYGPALRELCKHLLELGGWGTDWDVSVEWKESLPVDPVAERTALKMDRDMGIASLETIAGKLDYDWEIEKRKIAKEKEANQAIKTAAFGQMMQRRSAVVGQPGQPSQPMTPQEAMQRQDAPPGAPLPPR